MWWVIPGGVIHAPICKKLKNKLQRSNQRTCRDLCGNSKGENIERGFHYNLRKLTIVVA